MASPLSSDDTFFGNISRFLDEELPPSELAQFSELAAKRGEELTRFKSNRGKFQSLLGDIGGSEVLKHKLRNFVQEDQARETIEASDIALFERSQKLSDLFRRSTLGVLLLAFAGGVVYWLMPSESLKIDVIEHLGYEAIAIEEDPEGRTSLPSTDLNEIKQFVSTIPGAGFTPAVLRPLSGWTPEGVSIIDYDVIKVIAVNYISPERAQEKLHHFMFPGKMKDIPFRGEEADYRGLKYRVYASDRLNLLVWQQSAEMISVLAGHRSAPELAELARSGAPE